MKLGVERALISEQWIAQIVDLLTALEKKKIFKCIIAADMRMNKRAVSFFCGVLC